MAIENAESSVLLYWSHANIEMLPSRLILMKEKNNFFFGTNII